MMLGKWRSTSRIMKLDSCISSCTKIHSKLIKDLKLHRGKQFLRRSSVVQEIRPNLQNVCEIKKASIQKSFLFRKVKRWPREWEKITARHLSGKAAMLRIHKQQNKKVNNWTNKQTNEMNRQFAKDELQRAGEMAPCVRALDSLLGTLIQFPAPCGSSQLSVSPGPGNLTPPHRHRHRQTPNVHKNKTKLLKKDELQMTINMKKAIREM